MSKSTAEQKAAVAPKLQAMAIFDAVTKGRAPGPKTYAKRRRDPLPDMARGSFNIVLLEWACVWLAWMLDRDTGPSRSEAVEAEDLIFRLLRAPMPEVREHSGLGCREPCSPGYGPLSIGTVAILAHFFRGETRAAAIDWLEAYTAPLAMVTVENYRPTFLDRKDFLPVGPFVATPGCRVASEIGQRLQSDMSLYVAMMLGLRHRFERPNNPGAATWILMALGKLGSPLSAEWTAKARASLGAPARMFRSGLLNRTRFATAFHYLQGSEGMFVAYLKKNLHGTNSSAWCYYWTGTEARSLYVPRVPPGKKVSTRVGGGTCEVVGSEVRVSCRWQNRDHGFPDDSGILSFDLGPGPRVEVVIDKDGPRISVPAGLPFPPEPPSPGSTHVMVARSELVKHADLIDQGVDPQAVAAWLREVAK